MAVRKTRGEATSADRATRVVEVKAKAAGWTPPKGGAP